MIGSPSHLSAVGRPAGRRASCKGAGGAKSGVNLQYEIIVIISNYYAEAIAAIDLCVVPSVRFERLFAFIIIGHGRPQLLWFAVTRHPTAEWLAQQIVEAFPWETAPTYLVRDNDGAYGPIFQRRVRAMGIRDRPISPRSPWQNPYAERLIGTLRRDCLDHVLIFGARHLQRVPAAYFRYYNQTRTHLSLYKDAPLGRSIQREGAIVAAPILSGLHHCYSRICFSGGTGIPPLTPQEAEHFHVHVPQWEIRDEARRIERTFRFRNFREAFAHVQQVGELAETEGHHPDISFGWGYVTVVMQTKKIKGLHENDLIMAAKIDRLFERAS